MEIGGNTYEIKHCIEERIRILSEIVNCIQKEIVLLPFGKLQVSKRGKYVSYYHRLEISGKNGVYISKKNIKLAKELAQREYEEKLLEELRKQLYHLKCLRDIDTAKVFGEMHPLKRKLINPIDLSDEEYIKKWEEVNYDTRSFEGVTSELYSAKKERMRSKSECHIADTLNRLGVPYRYEYPLKLKGLGDYHPDFLCLNVKKRKEIVWEHFGIMGDENYVENTMYKIKCLELNGFKMGEDYVFSMESGKTPLSTKTVEQIIYTYLL